MVRIDNDETKGLARPFVVLAHVRTGGTFCCHALSNHHQVYCDRGEMMHHLSVWRQAEIAPAVLCRLLWNQTGYRASGFRLIYRQAFHSRVWPAIAEVKPHVIHLRRRSLIRQALSCAYQQQVRAGAAAYHPVHSFSERRPPLQRMDPGYAVAYVRTLQRERKQGRQRMKTYAGAVLDVYYEEMVDAVQCADKMSAARNAEQSSAVQMAPRVAAQVCDFLGVAPMPLRVDLRRDLPVKTPALFENWDEIRAALVDAGFGEMLERDA